MGHILDNDPEDMPTRQISKATVAKIREFEGNLRELCYNAMEAKDSLADDGFKSVVDGRDVYTGKALVFAHFEHELDKWIIKYFGGYEYPSD